MGIINRIFDGAGAETIRAVGGVAEVFHGNETERERNHQEAYIAAHGQFSSEFQHLRRGFFDRLVDALNRLPRPLLAFGTIGLFIYAMHNPPGFSEIMIGLQEVPDPLWWLMGAIVSFYFGARELHHTREGSGRGLISRIRRPQPAAAPNEPVSPEDPADANPVLDAWREGVVS